MRVVRGAEVEFEDRVEKPRQGRFRFKRLLEGQPGSPDNFLLQLVETFDDFFSPRHRHNFDQYRFQIRGDFDFDRDGVMSPGVVGYFPEGTRYGPQTSSVDSLTLVLQFGGASGSGYMSERQMSASIAELKKVGTFKDGVFFPNEGTGRKNQDGYEAAWENHNKRKLEYPAQLYQAPIFMNSANFRWHQLPGEPGVAEKALGNFAERRTGIDFLKIDAGARHRGRGHFIYYALSGAGTIGGQAWTKDDVLYTDYDEAHDIVAGEGAEFYVMMLAQARPAALSLAA